MGAGYDSNLGDPNNEAWYPLILPTEATNAGVVGEYRAENGAVVEVKITNPGTGFSTADAATIEEHLILPGVHQ